MQRNVLKLLVVSLFLLTIAKTGFAEETTVLNVEKADMMDHSAMMKGMDPSTMTDEQKAMQARMMEFTKVNEHHDFLKSLAGTWKTSCKFWMDPNGKPEESEGTSEAKVIMGGRFLEQTFNGTAMGQPFEGRGILGYDNMKKEYTSIWFDNMATGIMTGAGQYNPDTKTLAAEGSMSCPISQETHRWYRDVTTLTDADHYMYETFMKDKDGKEFKSMIITYTKVQP